MTENTETRDENKSKCKENKDKRLVLANKGGKWTKDDKDWDKKIPEKEAS